MDRITDYTFDTKAFSAKLHDPEYGAKLAIGLFGISAALLPNGAEVKHVQEGYIGGVGTAFYLIDEYHCLMKGALIKKAVDYIDAFNWLYDNQN